MNQALSKLVTIGWLLFISFILFALAFIYFEYYRDRGWVAPWNKNYDLKNEAITVKATDAGGYVIYSYKRDGVYWYRCRITVRSGMLKTCDFIHDELNFIHVEISDRTIYVDSNSKSETIDGSREHPYKTLNSALSSVKKKIYRCTIVFSLGKGDYNCDFDGMLGDRINDHASIKIVGSYE